MKSKLGVNRSKVFGLKLSQLKYDTVEFLIPYKAG